VKSKKYSDYTENEFLKLIKSLFDGGFNSEEERDSIVHEIINAAEHPDGTDILFYPKDDSPEGILNCIKEWRAKNGKPGFKPE
jgi:hypothetical protein